MTRRGIFGLLGGALLAKVVGPKLIAEPTEAAWRAVKHLPENPVRMAQRLDTYLPLEAVCARTLATLHRELKWLRLQQVFVDRESRLGESIATRVAHALTPPTFEVAPPILIEEQFQWVRYDSRMQVGLDLSDVDPDAPFGYVAERLVDPAAHSLVERIIGDIRHRGGAEIMACARLAVERGAGVERCVVAKNEDFGLSVRATTADTSRRPLACRPSLFLDIGYGLG